MRNNNLWNHYEIKRAFSFQKGLQGWSVPEANLAGWAIEAQRIQEATRLERSEFGESHLEARSLLSKCKGSWLSVCYSTQCFGNILFYFSGSNKVHFK